MRVYGPQVRGADRRPVMPAPTVTPTVASVSPVPPDVLRVVATGMEGAHYRRFGLEAPIVGLDVADEDAGTQPVEIVWRGYVWRALRVEAWTGWVPPAYWVVDAVRQQPLRPTPGTLPPEEP